MPRPITVAVAGATGRQGGALCRWLLNRGHAVRALTRKPGSSAALELEALGAVVHEADLDDGRAVGLAVEGADAFFLVTTPFEAGVQAEVRQGRAAAKIAKEVGVKHLVYASVANADRNTGVPHVESKREVEDYIRKLGVASTTIAPVFFMENFLGPNFIDGLRAGTLSMPLRPNRRLQMVAVQDIASFAGMVLERPTEFVGRRIDIASDSLTGPEIAGAMTRTGTTIVYVQAPVEPIRSRNPDFARMWEWFDQRGTDVDLSALASAYPEAGWHDFGHWVREQDWTVLDAAGPEQPTA
ncbi:MAG TPA: NmrA/HSCARG family protein [Anaeromyxobacteraceae bacterium]|nr:NmrA/HSCARG family protein [Anaeromyxobacteraceae bacterium]